MGNFRDRTSELEMLDCLFDELFPLMRSITGPALRESLEILQEEIPLEIRSVASGTEIFDWEIPPEWRIREAYLIGPDGKRYADLEKSNLSVVNYSSPVDEHLPLSELKSHLHTNSAVPDAIPYVTSYYERTWGFCLPYDTYKSLPEGEYHAYIDSEFIDGELTYGHTIVEGESDEEVLLSSYLCHPSMANNELSGPLVLTALYNRLKDWRENHYTYRFVLAPETIGSLAYLSEYGHHLQEHLISGAVLTCLGGPKDRVSFQQSRRGDSLLDKTVSNHQKYGAEKLEIRPFTPVGGSDERQYCSPGFDLPVGQFARTVYGQYDAYHSSNDDKEFMGVTKLTESTDTVERILQSLEYAGSFINTNPFGEPMLSKHDLYPSTNSPETWDDSSDDIRGDERRFLNAVLQVLNYSDGQRALVDIASKYEKSVADLIPVIEVLQSKGLIRRNTESVTI